MIAVERKLWDNRGAWPLDTADHLFMARAIDLIGQTHYGAQWDYEGPDDPEDESEKASDEWVDLLDDIEARAETMLQTVEGWVATWARDGKLVTAIRPKEGGAIVDQPKDIWIFEGWSSRFEECEISLATPFKTKGGWPSTHYLYVSRESLALCLRTIDANAAPAAAANPQASGTARRPMLVKATEADILDAARLHYRTDPSNTNLQKAPPKIKRILQGRSLSAKRNDVYQLLKRPEFSNQRRPPGNESKT